MAPATTNGDAVRLVHDALTCLGLNPRQIPHGRIDELRGGVQCFELKEGEGVDAAIVLSKLNVDSFQDEESRVLYKVEYAVRGDLKGVLPGRIVSSTKYELKGLLRRRLTGLRWETPLEDQGGYKGYQRPCDGGLPPGPGELWEGGPHQTLTERLNQASELNEALRAFTVGDDITPTNITVFSDSWGESIRIRGQLWLKAGDLAEIYAAPSYLKIVNRIGQHVKEVRRMFGGLTF
ncbi:MAG: hypothetical protein OEZ44_10220 [Candidatus Bathyarchaeota archaeon]|nr:hypothetical protein [Candidatus Bathyarchaeota archaeon]